jgi:hopanoid C-3 methylase
MQSPFLNYLANIPKVIDLAKETKQRLPGCLVFAGGHSASLTAKEIMAHGEGAIACVVRDEGEAVTPRVLEGRQRTGEANGDSRRHKH